MVGIAVVGAGRIGQVHARNAAMLPSVRVRYLVDLVAGSHRDDLAARLGAEIAEAVHFLVRQDRSAWPFELDLRPLGEKW